MKIHAAQRLSASTQTDSQFAEHLFDTKLKVSPVHEGPHNKYGYCVWVKADSPAAAEFKRLCDKLTKMKALTGTDGFQGFYKDAATKTEWSLAIETAGGRTTLFIRRIDNHAGSPITVK